MAKCPTCGSLMKARTCGVCKTKPEKKGKKK